MRDPTAATMVTQPTNPKSSALRGLLPILGVAVALCLAVGVWILPKSMVEPKAREVVLRGISDVQPPDHTKAEAKDWTELLEDFEQLRDRDNEPIIDPVPVTDNGDDTSPTPPDPTPTRPPWGYEGFIQEPNGFVAVVRTVQGQRFIYLGDEVTFREPRGETITFVVTEVTPEMLVISKGEFRYEYPIMRVSPAQMPGETRPNRRGETGQLLPGDAVSPRTLPSTDGSDTE